MTKAATGSQKPSTRTKQERTKMRSVWAVARNTIAQALRMKIVFIVVILLLAVLPIMSRIVVGDETLHGKLQTFVSYSLSLMTVLLSILTIAVSTYTLTNDIKRKYIFLVITKPLYRFQIICGKLLGVVIVDFVLLAIFSSIIYALTMFMPRIVDAQPEEVRQAKNEFFTARASVAVRFDEKAIQERALKAYKQLEKTNQLPEQMSPLQVLAELEGREKLKERSVQINGTKQWRFENIRVTDPNDSIFVRYKLEVTITPPDDKVHGVWEIGDHRQEEFGVGRWNTPMARVVRFDKIRTFLEIEIPAVVVAEDGYVSVEYTNTNLNQTTVIPQEVQVLYRVGSFTTNYIRVVLLVAARLIFLAALSISASTWLSLPVAFLLTTAVFCVGMINGFIGESFDGLSATWNLIYTLTLRPILWLFPVLDGDYNPTQFLVFGRYLTWRFLGYVYGTTIGIKAGLLTIVGIWIFSKREIAKAVT
jgi:hypothetical protein